MRKGMRRGTLASSLDFAATMGGRGGGDPASELAQERKGPWDRVVERS